MAAAAASRLETRRQPEPRIRISAVSRSIAMAARCMAFPKCEPYEAISEAGPSTTPNWTRMQIRVDIQILIEVENLCGRGWTARKRIDQRPQQD
jgi:hypothetical protein